MAAFTDIGAACSLAYCHQNDFLPFTCDCCNKVFCKEHFQYQDHECPLAQNKDHQVAVCPICQKSFAGSDDVQVNVLWERHIQSECKGRQQKEKCPVAGCKEKLTELSSIICTNCNTKVCLKHRFEDLHPCATFKKQNTAAKSWKHTLGFGSSSSTSKAKSGGSSVMSPPKLGGGGGLFGKKQSTGKASAQWPCGRCGKCDKCKASKSGAPPMWACSACTLRNPASASSCAACGKANGKVSSSPKASPKTSPRHEGSEWECSSCSYSNRATRTTCMMCGKKAPADGCVAF